MDIICNLDASDHETNGLLLDEFGMISVFGVSEWNENHHYILQCTEHTYTITMSNAPIRLHSILNNNRLVRWNACAHWTETNRIGNPDGTHTHMNRQNILRYWFLMSSAEYT